MEKNARFLKGGVDLKLARDVQVAGGRKATTLWLAISDGEPCRSGAASARTAYTQLGQLAASL
jgi:hypothetical protein